MRIALLLLLTALSLRADDLASIPARYYKADEPGAAVLVVKDGKTLLRKGYGLADLELNVPVTPDNVFRIGSMTKQFTAVAVLQLVQSGRIALSDPITKYLPDAPVHGRTITIEQLLTHTSGIPSYTDQPSFGPAMRRDMTPAQMMEMVRNVEPKFEPGAQWAYNNSGYILLGMLIEKVSGEPYAAYMRAHIFGPAGLTHTDYDENDRVIAQRAHGYSRWKGAWINAPYLSMTLPYAAGGLISTVDDLAKWNDALASGKLIDPKLLARARTPFRLNDGSSTNYGYGWAMRDYEGHPIVEHGGAINGFGSAGLLLPDDHLYVVVLSNANRQPPPSWIAELLATTAIGKPYAPVAVPLANPEAYVGEYGEMKIERRGDALTLVQPHGPPMTLIPLSPTRFAIKDAVGSVTIENGTLTLRTFGPAEIAHKSR